MAQESRAGLLERQRAAKAADLRVYRPAALEAVLFDIEDRYRLQRLLDPPRGLFLRIGGFPEGAGAAAGPAYRQSNHRASLTLSAAASVRRYWDAGATLALASQSRRRVFGELSAWRREYPEEDFYGLGRDSHVSGRTSYTFRETSVGGSAGVAPTSWLSISASGELTSPSLGRGRDREEPSIEQIFTDGSAPGLVAPPDLVRLGVSASVDSTGRPFGSPYGGRYAASYDRFVDRDLRAYSFDRWTLDLRQYVSVLGSSRTLALRAQLAAVVPDGRRRVPFYLQPALGGPDSLRGLPSRRLRDHSLLLLQAEYRFEVNAFLAGVLFCETGGVAHRLRDLRLDGLRHDYGGGVRVGLLGTVVFRAEVAFGAGEGTVLLARFSNAF